MADVDDRIDGEDFLRIVHVHDLGPNHGRVVQRLYPVDLLEFAGIRQRERLQKRRTQCQPCLLLVREIRLPETPDLVLLVVEDAELE